MYDFCSPSLFLEMKQSPTLLMMALIGIFLVSTFLFNKYMQNTVVNFFLTNSYASKTCNARNLTS